MGNELIGQVAEMSGGTNWYWYKSKIEVGNELAKDRVLNNSSLLEGKRSHNRVNNSQIQLCYSLVSTETTRVGSQAGKAPSH